MKKLVFTIVLLFVFVSCKMKLTTSIPNLFYGKWQHLDGSVSTRSFILDKNGRFKLTEFAYSPQKVTEGTYEYVYSSFHITDASGVITTTDTDGNITDYNFVWLATPSDGPLKLSLTELGGITRVYTYNGEEVLASGDNPPEEPEGEPEGGNE